MVSVPLYFRFLFDVVQLLCLCCLLMLRYLLRGASSSLVVNIVRYFEDVCSVPLVSVVSFVGEILFVVGGTVQFSDQCSLPLQ